jgi:hypothetical protein
METPKHLSFFRHFNNFPFFFLVKLVGYFYDAVKSTFLWRRKNIFFLSQVAFVAVVFEMEISLNSKLQEEGKLSFSLETKHVSTISMPVPLAPPQSALL